MAKNMQGGISSETESFNKGLLKDFDDVFYPEGTWSHARNAINNTVTGMVGIIGNEPANGFCTKAPYTIIGAINLRSDEWVIYSTDDTNSEIGFFKEAGCQYSKIVNDPCLGFKKSNLIIGVSKQNFDCTWQTYWADGNQPDRTMNIGNLDSAPYTDPWPGVPYKCVDTLPGPCENCEPILPLQLDCDRIRLSKLMSIPCTTIAKGAAGGSLQNGSYYAIVAYTVNQQKVTDYFTPSPVQALFDHDNLSGALLVSVSNLEQDVFDEFELVIVRTINQQTSAKRIGYYSTQGPIEISIDYINEALPTIPIEQIPLRSPFYERSEAIYRNGPYMLRVAPTGKFDFNYQPLANQINTEWVMVEQRPDYYRKGGNQTGYMRDEQYAFWIRWVYNTGEKSSSYHIPGRAAEANHEIDPATGLEYANFGQGLPDNVEQAQYDDQGGTYVAPRVWEMINTAYVTSPIGLLPADNAAVIPGLVIARGKMGYWESTERYPANKTEVWDASSHPWSNTGNTNHDLCGKPIRHHKMPADILDTTVSTDGSLLNYSRIRTTGAIPRAIRVLGVEFNNIRPPVDNDGVLIPGIIGYEILRSSREGNKTVVAKGILNNLRSYNNADNETVYYQNYPYNSLKKDHSLTDVSWQQPQGWNDNDNLATDYSNQKFTFHSPDTQFKNPFLSPQELKLYGEVGSSNNVSGSFDEVPGHPKQKLPTNVAFFVSMALGVALAGKAVQGQETRTIDMPRIFNAGMNSVPAAIISSGNGAPLTSGTLETAYQETVSTAVNTLALSLGLPSAIGVLNTGVGIINGSLVGVPPAGLPGGGIGGARNNSIEKSDVEYMPLGLKIFGGAITYAQYMTQGADATLDIIRGITKYQQYALSYTSHADMHRHSLGNARHGLANSRRYVKDSAYLENQLQQFGASTINNLFRGRTVALDLAAPFTEPALQDNTVQTVGTAIDNGLIQSNFEHHFDSFRTTASSYYAGLKIRLRNQYGQLDGIRQIPTGCINYIGNNITTASRFTSSITFGGDIYIGRYTEKNTFFYFYDWLMDQPDGTEFDYRLRSMINNPRFWADFTKFDTNQFLQNSIGNILSGNWSQLGQLFPSSMSNLDLSPGTNSIPGGNAGDGAEGDDGLLAAVGIAITNAFQLIKKHCYFYLFQSGVRDFFVESEINVDLRDWGPQDAEWHYDAYRLTDLNLLFSPNIIKSGNYFKYDMSLGVSKTFNNYISWGNMQPRYYDPNVSETCYTYYSKRVIYSLPQVDEAIKDAWKIFLVNNYKDFPSKVTAIKPIGKNGAMLLFENDAPVQFLGSESLELDMGTKITIGDGSLFSQALQSLSNADPEFQHGSCQNRLSIINTPTGIYYMSQAQGKIFSISGNGLEELSAAGMRWWFNKYLPYTLLVDFPDFPLTDNPVAGIGCQATFDNTDLLAYFCKRDYRIKPEFKGRVTYTPNKNPRTFTLDGRYRILLGDPMYFDDTSWTVSYDPKTQVWVSFHDWHPELAFSTKTRFLTTITNTAGQGEMWTHNDRTDLFANYYGKDYPFEIEYIAQTGQTVNTLKSLEYILECYTYDIDGIDTYHVLDFNFDHLVVHNTEQVSGVLNMQIMPKNNAPALVNYPVVNLNSIDILYSKVEQKYRVNQFWDITRDRGEYTYPNVQQPIWNTQLNGYIRALNTNNLDYAKPAFQRKKFRHYTSHVLLYRNVSGPVKMLLKLANNKNLYSPR